MNSRERVLATLNRQPADRCPLDLGGTYTTGIHLLAYRELRRFLGLAEKPIRCIDIMQQLAEVDTDVLEALGCDIVQINPGIIVNDWQTLEIFPGLPVQYPATVDLKRKTGCWILTDEHGNQYFKPDHSFYFDAEDINCWYELPFHATPQNLCELRRRTVEFYNQTEYALTANFGGGFGSMSPDFLINLLLEPERMKDELEKKCNELIAYYSKIYEAIGEYTFAIALYSDYGTQQSLIMSPATFRQLLKPCFTRFCTWIHENTSWKVFLHSCGAIEPLINDFIEMGIDALNPVQVSASGMKAEKLKTYYGNRLVFWGGRL